MRASILCLFLILTPLSFAEDNDNLPTPVSRLPGNSYYHLEDLGLRTSETTERWMPGTHLHNWQHHHSAPAQVTINRPDGPQTLEGYIHMDVSSVRWGRLSIPPIGAAISTLINVSSQYAGWDSLDSSEITIHQFETSDDLHRVTSVTDQRPYPNAPPFAYLDRIELSDGGPPLSVETVNRLFLERGDRCGYGAIAPPPTGFMES